MLQDIPLILSTWFLISLWQIVAIPWIYLIFKKHLVDGGWAFGRVLIWIFLGSVVWFLAHLGLPVNRSWFIYGLFGLTALASGIYTSQHWSQIKDFFLAKKKLILVEEILFLIFFVFLSLMRGFNPDINGLEKFMDVAFMNSYLRSPTLPLEDMWLAGAKVNYYTFGHFLGSIVGNFWSLSMDYAYNLLLALIMGLVAIQTFGFAINLAYPLFKDKKNRQKKLIKVGLLASFLIVLGGNGHAVWYVVKNFGFSGYWYPDATRFIERTIHEFPAYSFIVSDLHAHVWGMPLVIFLLTNILIWLKTLVNNYQQPFESVKSFLTKPYILRAAGLGFLFGLIMSTSTWDLLIYTLFLSILGLILLVVDRKLWWPLVASALAVGLMTALSASPWWLNFKSISEGVRMAEEHSPLWQLIVLWGPHVLMSLLTLIFALSLFKNKEKPQDNYFLLFIAGLVLTALLLLVLPEFVYMKDIYPNHPRANTMFKLTFQAFIMMGLVVSWFVGLIQLKEKFEPDLHLFLKLIMVLFVLSVGIYPFFGYRDFYNRLKNYQGLNGLSWMEKKYYHDYQALNWLRKNVEDRPVILEAVGESYTDFARMSTFSGLPTVLGWRVHEWLWRGGFDIPRQRTEEVTTVYSKPKSKSAQDVLKKHQVKYIILGKKEREAYDKLDINGLLSLGEIVYQHGQTAIVELNVSQ